MTDVVFEALLVEEPLEVPTTTEVEVTGLEEEVETTTTELVVVAGLDELTLELEELALLILLLDCALTATMSVAIMANGTFILMGGSDSGISGKDRLKKDAEII